MEVYCFMTHLKIIIEEIVECVWEKGRCDSVGLKDQIQVRDMEDDRSAQFPKSNDVFKALWEFTTA